MAPASATDAYFANIRGLADSFEDPFVLTPGDNEWTDCHRANNGGYHPLERLAALRSLFYPEPGTTIGGREKAVLTQANEPGFGEFVENQLWLQSRTAFGVVHVVGSNNDLQPWFGAAETPLQTVQRLAEYEARLAAALAWLGETFAVAERKNAKAVVLAMQADSLGRRERVHRDRPADRRPVGRVPGARPPDPGGHTPIPGRPAAGRGEPAARRHHRGGEPHPHRRRRRNGERVAAPPDRPAHAADLLLGAGLLAVELPT